MRDSEGDRYFYEPRAWVMSARQPRGTALCNVCSDQFATARMSSSKTNYCEVHFNEAIATLQDTGVPDSSIIFQLIDGNLEGCIDNDYYEYGETSLEGYLAGNALTFKNKKIVVDNTEDNDDESDDTDDDGIACYICSEVYAEFICDQCDKAFCSGCFEKRHAKVPWKLHTCTPINSKTR
jgi:hypothetical protein